MREEINELDYVISSELLLCLFYDPWNNGISLRLWALDTSRRAFYRIRTNT
jgi:hypothetical protein